MTFPTAANDTVEQRDFYETHTAYRRVWFTLLVKFKRTIWSQKLPKQTPTLTTPEIGTKKQKFLEDVKSTF